MPNIELHGYGDKPIALLNKIRQAVKDSPDAIEIVTEVYSTAVTDINNKPMPYLRVVAGPEGLDDLLERLKPLGEDIEVGMLGAWIPKT